MSDWREIFTSESAEFFAVIAAWLGGVLGAFWAAMTGRRNGKATSPAVAAAVAASVPCVARDLGPVVERLRSDIRELREDHERDMETVRDLLIRIEDRTRGR